MSTDKMRRKFEAYWASREIGENNTRMGDYCFENWCTWQAALSQSEPAQVSQPVAETYVINKGGSGEFIAIDWKDKEGSYVGLLYSSPPDYEALKLRVAELEAATEHLGLTPQQAKDGLSRHKALVTERDRLQSDKANLIQQAEIQAQEARTMKSIVIGILTDLDLPQKDYDARSNIAQKFSRLQSECDRLKEPRPFECWSNDDGDSWGEDPADGEFVEGLKVGDTFELLAGFGSVRINYIVTKAPDDVSDDYEVEQAK